MLHVRSPPFQKPMIRYNVKLHMLKRCALQLSLKVMGVKNYHFGTKGVQH